MMCPFMSTDSVEFILSDEATRLEKTKALSEYGPSQKYLDVCFNFDNCGVCSKCYRTLITFDLIGCLDKYTECFDIEKFRKHRAQAYYWLLVTQSPRSVADNAIFANELYKLAKKQKAIPLSSKIKYIFFGPVLWLKDKIAGLVPLSLKRKILKKLKQI